MPRQSGTQFLPRSVCILMCSVRLMRRSVVLTADGGSKGAREDPRAEGGRGGRHALSPQPLRVSAGSDGPALSQDTSPRVSSVALAPKTWGKPINTFMTSMAQLVPGQPPSQSVGRLPLKTKEPFRDTKHTL